MLFFRVVSRPAQVRPVFDLVQNGSVTLCFSAEVLAEIRDVLTRPKLVAKYPALTPEAVDAFLANICEQLIGSIIRRSIFCFHAIRRIANTAAKRCAIIEVTTWLWITQYDLLDMIRFGRGTGFS